MAHDVFVSYPHDEKPMADAVVHALEERGVRCWAAPRDVPPGADWAGEIMTAITSSRMVVLVFSDSTNESEHILREVRAASDAHIPIVPFRTTDADPSPSLQYYLGGKHWLDAITEPIEAHLDELATTVTRMLGSEIEAPRPTPAPAPTTPVATAPPRRHLPRWALLGSGLAVAAAVVIGVIVATTGSDDEPTDAGPDDATEPDATESDEGSDDGGQPDSQPAEPRSFEELFADVKTAFVLANGQDGGTGPNFLCVIQASEVGCEPHIDEGAVGGAEDVAVADFDGNGQLDWVFVGTEGEEDRLNPHRVCLGFGPDNPCTELFVTVGTEGEPLPSLSVEVADLDEDGDVDVVIGGSASDHLAQAFDPLHVCLGDGGGGFSCAPVANVLGAEVTDLAIADVDVDGALDVVLASNGPDQLCLGDGTGALACSTEVDSEGSETMAVVTGDFDEDGRVDVLYLNARTPNRMCLGPRSSTDAFECTDVSPPGQQNQAADAGDVNGDGHLDVLVGRADGDQQDLEELNSTSLCLGDGTGALACELTPWDSGGALGILLTDMNRDGSLDYLKLGVPWGTSLGNASLCLGTGDGSFECEPLGLSSVDERGFTISGLFTGVAVFG